MAEPFLRKVFNKALPRTRYRIWKLAAIGAYALACGATIAAVATSGEVNEIKAELRIYKSKIPTGIDTSVEGTSFVVRNGSGRKWEMVQLVLNGEFKHWLREVEAGKSVTVFAHEFSRESSGGEGAGAGYEVAVRSFAIYCDRGKFERFFGGR